MAKQAYLQALDVANELMQGKRHVDAAVKKAENSSKEVQDELRPIMGTLNSVAADLDNLHTYLNNAIESLKR